MAARACAVHWLIGGPSLNSDLPDKPCADWHLIFGGSFFPQGGAVGSGQPPALRETLSKPEEEGDGCAGAVHVT